MFCVERLAGKLGLSPAVQAPTTRTETKPSVSKEAPPQEEYDEEYHRELEILKQERVEVRREKPSSCFCANYAATDAGLEACLTMQ